MKKKSIKINMVLNVIKSVMNIIFPLITFPYASRVLGVENLGKYDFSNSIISYFIIFAGLGIEKYAIREGAGLRDNKERISRFGSEVFSINLCSTAISYVVFLIIAFAIPRLNDYRAVLFVLSIQISMKMLGVEWLYSIYEDYLYITIRSIAIQIISLVLLFAFVKSSNDLLSYCLIHIVSSTGAYVFNYFHSKKYITIRITKKIDWKRHIKPILILFAMDATIVIYVASDKTILGFLCGEYSVGIYAVASKLYSVTKSILSAILVVSIPRLSMLWAKEDRSNFTVLSESILKTLLSLLLPMIVGMIMLRREIILFISGEAYIKANESFVILSFSLLFCMLAWFWGQCILIPQKKEMFVFKATLVSAITNIVLNLILIPIWKENAAAFTTALSQAIAFAMCWYSARKDVKISGVYTTVYKTSVGCIGIVLCCVGLRFLKEHVISYTVLSVLSSLIVYYLIERVLKNEALISSITRIKMKRLKLRHTDKEEKDK